MPVKHFLLNPYKGKSSKESIDASRSHNEIILKDGDNNLLSKSVNKLDQSESLIHVEGRIVVKLDMENKNSWTFSDGTKIRYERNFNNFNRRETQPVNCIVISAENIPSGAEMLVDHNAFHETNRINDYKNNFEHSESDRVRYFSVPVYECYAWRTGKENWQPFNGFEFALRVFKPYEGLIQNIEPKKLDDILYVLTGELKGNVVKTIKASDYVIVYQGDDGQEKKLLCFRPDGEEQRGLEPEAIAIMHELTEQINEGKLLIGYETKDAKCLNQQ